MYIHIKIMQFCLTSNILVSACNKTKIECVIDD